MPKKKTIIVQNTEIGIVTVREEDFISLTDMVRNFEGGNTLIEQWLRNKDTILFMGAWEQIHNPDFNSLEFEGIRNEAGRNSFFLSAKKWIANTKAKGLIAKAGRYGGTYAHADIALEFGSWLSPEFKLFLITEFKRLKEEEIRRNSLDWDLHRTLSKINYRIHTDAVKEHMPPDLSKRQMQFVFASEADLINKALYGFTAKEWRENHPEKEGNVRDHSTTLQLVILANLEVLNAQLIRLKMGPGERLLKLNQSAILQAKSLLGDKRVQSLDEANKRRE